MPLDFLVKFSHHSEAMSEILESYVESVGISWRELGRLTGLDHSTFTGWRKGTSKPSYENALRIEQATDGKITADQIMSEALNAEREKASQ